MNILLSDCPQELQDRTNHVIELHATSYYPERIISIQHSTSPATPRTPTVNQYYEVILYNGLTFNILTLYVRDNIQGEVYSSCLGTPTIQKLIDQVPESFHFPRKRGTSKKTSTKV